MEDFLGYATVVCRDYVIVGKSFEEGKISMSVFVLVNEGGNLIQTVRTAWHYARIWFLHFLSFGGVFLSLI